MLRIVLMVSLLFSCTALAAGSKELKVLFLGDSLTEGQGLDKSEAYPALVDSELKKNGYHDVIVVNAGISGSTSASGPSRLKWYMRAKPQPTIVVLALGANDGLRGQDLKKAAAKLGETIELAKKYGLTVLLAGMKLPPSYGNEYAENFAKMFPVLAEKHQVPLIPFLLEGVAADPKLNRPDGIHPNADGYRIVAATVYKHLVPLLDRHGAVKSTLKSKATQQKPSGGN